MFVIKSLNYVFYVKSLNSTLVKTEPFSHDNHLDGVATDIRCHLIEMATM